MTETTEEPAGQLRATDEAGTTYTIDLFQTICHVETVGGVRKSVPTLRRAECNGEDVYWVGDGRYQMADGTMLTAKDPAT